MSVFDIIRRANDQISRLIDNLPQENTTDSSDTRATLSGGLAGLTEAPPAANAATLGRSYSVPTRSVTSHSSMPTTAQDYADALMTKILKAKTAGEQFLALNEVVNNPFHNSFINVKENPKYSESNVEEALRKNPKYQQIASNVGVFYAEALVAKALAKSGDAKSALSNICDHPFNNKFVIINPMLLTDAGLSSFGQISKDKENQMRQFIQTNPDYKRIMN